MMKKRAKQLYETAAAMEQVCRKGDTDAAEAEFKRLRASLADLAVHEMPAQDEPANLPPAELDPIAVHMLLNQLLDSLDSDLGAAQVRLLALQQSDYAAPLKELEDALNSFDIDARPRPSFRPCRQSELSSDGLILVLYLFANQVPKFGLTITKR